MPRTVAVGIDLGTTRSVIAVERSENIQCVMNKQSSRLTPSVVRLGSLPRVIGQLAYDNIGEHSKETVHSVKRILGRGFSDLCVQDLQASVGFCIVNKEGKPAVEVELHGSFEYFAPEQVSAMILGSLKSDADRFLGNVATKAVITVPAAFNEAQRRATKNAGMIAGFDVLAVINEPTAAALQWLHENEYDRKNIDALVFDMGGGTTDVSIVAVGENCISVILTNGDANCGGCHIDKILEDYFVKKIKDEHAQDISKVPKVMAKLRKVCVDLKERLSRVKSASGSLFFNKSIKLSLTRDEFENLIDPIRTKVNALVKKSLELYSSKCSQDKDLHCIKDIVFVGGSTRMHWLRTMFKELVSETVSIHKSTNCDEVVAEGAAIYASILMKSPINPDISVFDIAPVTYAIEDDGGIISPIIKQGTPLPVSETRQFTVAEADQLPVSFQIYESNSDSMTEFRKLEKFELTLDKKGPCDIEVTFSLSKDFLFSVTARDVTGRENVSLPVNAVGCDDQDKIEDWRRIEKDLRNSDEEEEKRLDLIGQLEKIEYERAITNTSAGIEINRTATIKELETKLFELQLN